MAAINTDFESGLSGLRTAKAFANENKELDKFDSANLSYRDSKADFYRAMGRFNAVMEIFLVYSFCDCNCSWWCTDHVGPVEYY